MKGFILLIALLTSFHVYADKVEDLGVEAEAEQVDVYDQQALNTQAHKEAVAMEQKTHQLQGKISHLEGQRKVLIKKVDTQTERYARAAKAAHDAEVKASRAQAVHDQLKAKVDRLRSQTQASERRVQAANSLEKSLNRDIRNLGREKTQLIARGKTADRRIVKAQRKIKTLRARQRKLSQYNARQRRLTARKEARAEKLEQKALEAEL